MDGYFRAGVGLDMGQDMMGRMEAIMNMYESKDSFIRRQNERSMTISLHPPPIPIDEDYAREAQFQPGYDEDEYDEIDYSKIQMPQTAGHNYNDFERKLSQGILDAPNLNLHQIPPSIFDNIPPITIMYLKDNPIHELPEFFFDELPSLAWLDIRENKLTVLPALNNRHKALRVILLQGNQIRALPYTLALAEKLKTIGLTGNPITIPPEDIRKQGCKKMLAYMKERMFMRVPMDESGDFEAIPTIPDEDDEQLRNDLMKTAQKRVYKFSASSLKQKETELSLHSKKSEEEKRAERLKYTWELWKRIPYEGKSRMDLFQKSLEEVRCQVMAKLNTQQEAILQKCKSNEALRKWRSETRMLQFRERPTTTHSTPAVTAPFGNDLNQIASTPSRVLKPEEFQKEVTECWDKLKDFASNPTPISDTQLALGRLKEVEEIQQRLMNMKLSMKSGEPL